jgi:hypothetical protein
MPFPFHKHRLNKKLLLASGVSSGLLAGITALAMPPQYYKNISSPPCSKTAVCDFFGNLDCTTNATWHSTNGLGGYDEPAAAEATILFLPDCDCFGRVISTGGGSSLSAALYARILFDTEDGPMNQIYFGRITWNSPFNFSDVDAEGIGGADLTTNCNQPIA